MRELSCKYKYYTRDTLMLWLLMLLLCEEQGVDSPHPKYGVEF